MLYILLFSDNRIHSVISGHGHIGPGVRGLKINVLQIVGGAVLGGNFQTGDLDMGDILLLAGVNIGFVAHDLGVGIVNVVEACQHMVCRGKEGNCQRAAEQGAIGGLRQLVRENNDRACETQKELLRS